jgi:glycosyltransferase involved in cell wall biosynthesis
VGVVPYDVVLSIKYKKFFANSVTRYLCNYLLFFWAIFKYDVFLMCLKGRLLDRTVLFRYLELPLLKLAEKKIILNTFGTDVQTPRLTLPQKHLKYSVLEGYLKDPYYKKINEREVAINRRHCEKWADCIISAIDHVEYLKRVDEYFHMRCIDTEKVTPCYHTENKSLLIVHAPNHRYLKGTHYLIEAIKKLKREGLKIQLKILEKRPHREVMAWIEKCDIVADQFLVGTYARLAIEAMAYGKPVLCYFREDLFPYNPIWKECPIVNTSPDKIEENIKKLYFDRDLRVELGRRGREYVEKYHSLEYVGKRLDEIITKVWKKGGVN